LLPARGFGDYEMTGSATPEYLMKGAAYALEQCGLCLRDAELSYRNGSYANAVVLAAFAREALGQWIILLDLRQKVLGGGKLPIRKLKTLYDDHELKQTAAMLSFTMTGDRDSGVGKLIMSRLTAVPGSDEWKRTDDALKKLNTLKTKRVPQVRHKLRMLAMYIDPEGDDWNRPVKRISQADAREFIEDARNDYAVQRLNGYNNFQEDEESELFKALEQWSDRPILPLPPGPLPF
jgi:AbiV family abortive infection protein